MAALVFLKLEGDSKCLLSIWPLAAHDLAVCSAVRGRAVSRRVCGRASAAAGAGVGAGALSRPRGCRCCVAHAPWELLHCCRTHQLRVPGQQSAWYPAPLTELYSRVETSSTNTAFSVLDSARLATGGQLLVENWAKAAAREAPVALQSRPVAHGQRQRCGQRPAAIHGAGLAQ